MNEEQLKQRIKYAGEKKPSMNRRKQNHDYKARRMYMITMTTEERKPLFGTSSGKSFDAFARGQLLFLGPTRYSNEHKTITRSECLNLNEIAKRLCEP